MPEEQSTNLEPESDVQGSASNDGAPQKSRSAVDANLPPTSKSDSPKPSSSQKESPDAQTNHQNPKAAPTEPASTNTKPAKTPSRIDSKSSEENTGDSKRATPQEPASTNTASERKPIEAPPKIESPSSADSPGDSKQAVPQEPASIKASKRKPTKTPSKTESRTSADSSGGSKIEAAFFQVLGLINKIVSPIFSTLRKALVESKLYGNLQDRFKPLQPIFRFFSWIWKQIIVGIVGNIIIKPLWGVILKFLRGRFPNDLKAFSDRFLTIVSVSLLAVVYWLFSSLMPATSSQPAGQKPPTPVVTAPQPGPTAPPALQPAPMAEAPAIDEPPPLPEPEQKQIIDVQAQVAEVFDRYSQDLIQSVQANFQAERLVIQVSDRWFDLPRTEQNQLGTDVLERSRKLEFPKLEIRDQKDELLAREPVVGSNIIVLQRRTAPAEVAIDNPA